LAIAPASATLTLGSPLSLKITMLNAAGKPVPAGSDTSLRLTLTTLRSLRELNSRGAGTSQAPARGANTLDQRTISLAPQQLFSRLEGVLPRGRSDVTVKVLSQQTGQIRLFAESSNLSPGEAVLIVVGKSAQLNAYAWSDPGPGTGHEIVLEPVVWRPRASAPAQARMKLELNAPGVPARIDGNRWVADFSVALKSVADSRYLAAPEQIRIMLKVLSGSAKFDQEEVRIETGQASSEPFCLRSGPGGQIKLEAAQIQTGALRIDGHQIPFEFARGTVASHLVLRVIDAPALANNLAAITVEVRALQEGPDKTPSVVRAEDESLLERVVSFSTDRGFGIRFDGGSNKVTIPQNQEFGEIKLFSSLPAKDLKLSAQSTNGLGQPIYGDVRVSFEVPLRPILCAILGGLLWGVCMHFLRKAAWLPSLIRGGVGGFLIYVVLFFGALMVSYADLTGLPLDLAKLPSQSSLAAVVIGLLGAGPAASLLESTARLSGRGRKSG
jgi:hypothetical protein